MCNLSVDTKKYLSKFYVPKMSSYKFLKSFFAALAKKEERSISRDLSSIFYDINLNYPEYREYLKEFKFKNNGIFIYSNELEDNILTLQNIGLLGKKNPSFGVILIEYSDNITKETLDLLSRDEYEVIDQITNLYISEYSKK